MRAIATLIEPTAPSLLLAPLSGLRRRQRIRAGHDERAAVSR
jgi:hypothetical protein